MSTPAFAGSIPQTYHAYLGPMIFEDYARDTATRLKPRENERILELACGTGIVTKALLGATPAGASLTATDLAQPMIDVARTHLPDARIAWKQADACAIPFEDRSFDAIACQFGVMFFPDKVKAMREARRVLKPGGRYVFNVWDSLIHNPIPGVVHEALRTAMPDNPPTFLARLPYGYFDVGEIERVTRAGGFTNVKIEHVGFPSVAPTADHAARGFVEGTPVRAELAEKGVADPTPLREAAARSLAARLGDRPCRSTMRAVVVTAS